MALRRRWGAGKKRVTSPKRARSRWSDGEVTDDVIVALLSVGQGEAGVDLQGLAGGVAAIRLDERVIDALGLEPGKQEVAQGVRADRGGDAAACV